MLLFRLASFPLWKLISRCDAMARKRIQWLLKEVSGAEDSDTSVAL